MGMPSFSICGSVSLFRQPPSTITRMAGSSVCRLLSGSRATLDMGLQLKPLSSARGWASGHPSHL